jgi:hypothetical protein
MTHRRRRTDEPAPHRDHNDDTDGSWLAPLMVGVTIIILLIIKLALR